VRIAIDDFGTGYSNFTRLGRLPMDILKIDKSFVDDIATDAGAGNLVRAIMALGGALRLDTVAEGVETPGQLAVLSASTCGHAQGYLFSRPMPGPACVDYLLEHLTGVALHA
jgi:EAL domain-containing protein (putative c-di-GMP-specific phosphodiesterase class I)